MLISELKEQLEAGKPIDEIIEIKQYISVMEKHLITTKIIDSSITTDENGLSKIDYFYKLFTSDISLLSNYTNIDFSDELMELINEYDYLAENGYVECIINKIPENEKDFIVDLVEDELNQTLKLENSIEFIVASKLEKLINKFPNNKELKSLSKSLVKDLNKMDWDKVPMLKEIWKTANFKQGDQVGK